MDFVFKKKEGLKVSFGSLNNCDVFYIDSYDKLFMKINAWSAICIFCEEHERKAGVLGHTYDFGEDRVVHPLETKMVVYIYNTGD